MGGVPCWLATCVADENKLMCITSSGTFSSEEGDKSMGLRIVVTLKDSNTYIKSNIPI